MLRPRSPDNPNRRLNPRPAMVAALVLIQFSAVGCGKAPSILAPECPESGPDSVLVSVEYRDDGGRVGQRMTMRIPTCGDCELSPSLECWIEYSQASGVRTDCESWTEKWSGLTCPPVTGRWVGVLWVAYEWDGREWKPFDRGWINLIAGAAR